MTDDCLSNGKVIDFIEDYILPGIEVLFDMVLCVGIIVGIVFMIIHG